MLSTDYNFSCDIHPSKQLAIIYSCCQVVVISQLLMWQLDICFKFAILLWCMVHAIWMIKYHLLADAKNAVKRLLIKNGIFYAKTNNQQKWRRIYVDSSSRIFIYLILLRFKYSSKSLITHNLYLFRDMLTDEQHRKLRVLLRYRAAI